MSAPAADPAVEGIAVDSSGSTVVLSPGPCLDAAAGRALVTATRDAVADGAARVDIDLRSLRSFTAEGTLALVECRDVASALEEGLHYRTGRGPGRDALLAAYSA